MELLQNACLIIISDNYPWLNLEENEMSLNFLLNQPNQFIKALESAAVMNQEKYTKMSLVAFDFEKTFTFNPKVLDVNLRLFGI